jgi:cytochrome c553
MAGMAQNLKDDEIEALAEYYGRQQPSLGHGGAPGAPRPEHAREPGSEHR